MSVLVLVKFDVRNGMFLPGEIASVPRDYADRLIAAGVAHIADPKTKKEPA